MARFFEHELHTLIRTDPKAAAVRIDEVLAKHDGLIADAATELGCGYRTLRRWIATLREAKHPVAKVRIRGKTNRKAAESVPASG